MPQNARPAVLALTAALVLAVGLSGCGWRKPSSEPQPPPRVGPTPRPVAPGADERITITAYFADGATAALVPVEREVSGDEELGAYEAVEALIDGPMPDEGLQAIMPEGTALENVTIDAGAAHVRMNQAFYDNFPRSGSFGNLCLYAIVNTLTNIAGIDEVVIEVPGGGKLLGELDVAAPLSRNDDIVTTK